MFVCCLVFSINLRMLNNNYCASSSSDPIHIHVLFPSLYFYYINILGAIDLGSFESIFQINIQVPLCPYFKPWFGHICWCQWPQHNSIGFYIIFLQSVQTLHLPALRTTDNVRKYVLFSSGFFAAIEKTLWMIIFERLFIPFDVVGVIGKNLRFSDSVSD